MTIDLDDGAERDDLAHAHLLTPTKRLHAIAQILANGIHRQREGARRMGESGDISAVSGREEDGLEPSGPVRLDRPPPALVDALRTGESRCTTHPTRPMTSPRR